MSELLTYSIQVLPISHTFSPGGSGERAAVTLSRVAGYRRSLRGRQRRPIIRSNTHAPDQTESQPRLRQCRFDLAARAVAILLQSDFHKFSRAVGPKGLNREHPTGTERKSLTQECGWKGGDRGGLAARKQDQERALFTLDMDRPSHGRTQTSRSRKSLNGLLLYTHSRKFTWRCGGGGAFQQKEGEIGG